MMEGERAALDDTPESLRNLLRSYSRPSFDMHRSIDLEVFAPQGPTRVAELSQAALLPEDLLRQNHLFPEGRLDQDLPAGRSARTKLVAAVDGGSVVG